MPRARYFDNNTTYLDYLLFDFLLICQLNNTIATNVNKAIHITVSIFSFNDTCI